MTVAGTGIAAVSILAGEFLGAGVPVKVLLGMRDSAARPPLTGDKPLQQVTEAVYDNGTVGAVLGTFARTLNSGRRSRRAVYVVGPHQFVERALETAREAGVGLANTYVSLERLMLCGVGLSGACSCGGELTCQYGTFVTAEALRNEKQRESDRNGAADD